MDFSFTEEQTLLQDSVEKFITNDYHFEDRQKVIKTDLGFSAENWNTFAELGWLGVPFAEEDGGFGGGAVELMLMMESFGKGLVVEPFLPSIVMAGGVIKHGSDAQKESLLAPMIAGDKRAALAYAEPQSRFNLADVSVTAKKDGDGYTLNGAKCVVLGGPGADMFVVSARTDGGQRDQDGISMFVVPADANGVSRRDYPTVDGGQACELTLENVSVAADHLIGEEGKGYAILEQAIDESILAVGSQAVGAMEVLYKTTVEYCKTREQFGQPIGKFQVLQHRMVDMFMEHEQSKSLMYMAAMRMDEGYGPEAQKAISAFKVQIGKSGRFVGQNAIQLHGGMGMTDELSVGHYFKRITVIETLFGNADHHLRRYGSL